MRNTFCVFLQIELFVSLGMSLGVYRNYAICEVLGIEIQHNSDVRDYISQCVI
jgi:hypothetical protein